MNRDFRIHKGRQRAVKSGPLNSCSRDEHTTVKNRTGCSEMTVVTRRQTAQEQRRFESALELLLIAMVRQEIASRRQGKNGE